MRKLEIVCIRPMTSQYLLCHYLYGKLSVLLNLVFKCEDESPHELLAVIDLHKFVRDGRRLNNFVEFYEGLSAQVTILYQR